MCGVMERSPLREAAVRGRAQSVRRSARMVCGVCLELLGGVQACAREQRRVSFAKYGIVRDLLARAEANAEPCLRLWGVGAVRARYSVWRCAGMAVGGLDLIAL